MNAIHSILVKYITLFDAKETIARPKYINLINHLDGFNYITANTIEVDIFPDRLEIGYWVDNEPQWRVYRGDYDLVKTGASDYDSGDYEREESMKQALNRLGGGNNDRV
jgi:hypothetical protein